jgi:hypothetical protein
MSRLTLQTGDWILPHGANSGIARLIRKFTFGKVNHATIVYDSATQLETDGSWFKAKFTPIAKYDNKEVYIVRPLFLTDPDAVKHLCEKYVGTIYDYIQIGVQGLCSFLAPQIQQKIVSFVTGDKFMICSELVARITFEATGQKLLRDFQGMTPEMLLEVAYNNPDLFTVEHTTLTV